MFYSYENLNLFIYKDCQVIVRLWETITRGGVWRRYAMLIRLGCRWRCWWWWWWYCCIGCITAGGVMCSCDIWSTLIFPFTTLPNISTVMAQQFITTTVHCTRSRHRTLVTFSTHFFVLLMCMKNLKWTWSIKKVF